MLKNYTDVWDSEKIGGSYFKYYIYPRDFIVCFGGGCFGILYAMLAVKYLTPQEMAIMSLATGTVGTLIHPLLSNLRFITISKFLMLLEIFHVLIPVCYALGLYEANVFLYLDTLAVLLYVMLSENFIIKHNVQVQRKTTDKSSEYRNRGRKLMQASAGLLGGLLLIMVMGIDDSLETILGYYIVYTIAVAIVFLVTYPKIMKYYYRAIK